MSHPDDGQLHALVDGELSPMEAAGLQAHLDDCPPCRARLAEARSLLGECDRIVATLDVPPQTTAAPTPRRRPTADYRMLGLAASALLVVTIGWAVLRPGGSRAPASEAPQVAMPSAAVTEAPAPSAPERTKPMAATEPARRKDAAPAATSNELAGRDAAGAAPEEKREMRQEPGKEVAGRAAAAPQAMRADTPPPTPAKGVELNDLPPWKAKVAAPSPPPASARFHVDGLDVVSSTPLPGGGLRLVYSVNGTPVEFDQVPAGAASPAAPGGDIHELRWPRDGFDLTLRSRLALGELELLRQRVR